jgi:hypothetical protein
MSRSFAISSESSGTAASIGRPAASSTLAPRSGGSEILATRANVSPPPRAVRPAPDPCEAERIDTALRRIARQDASERLALGRLAKVFSVGQGHHDLGFARIGDYTRERLGISTSQFYELAQVATSLVWLPLINAALARGDISWTKARELATVAAPDTQEQWLALASQYTADELHALIAACRAEVAAALANRPSAKDADRPFWGGASSSGGPDDEEIDDEPAVDVVIRCPQSVRLLWWELLRLSSRGGGKRARCLAVGRVHCGGRTLRNRLAG